MLPSNTDESFTVSQDKHPCIMMHTSARVSLHPEFSQPSPKKRTALSKENNFEGKCTVFVFFFLVNLRNTCNTLEKRLRQENYSITTKVIDSLM